MTEHNLCVELSDCDAGSVQRTLDQYIEKLREYINANINEFNDAVDSPVDVTSVDAVSLKIPFTCFNQVLKGEESSGQSFNVTVTVTYTYSLSGRPKQETVEKSYTVTGSMVSKVLSLTENSTEGDAKALAASYDISGFSAVEFEPRANTAAQTQHQDGHASTPNPTASPTAPVVDTTDSTDSSAASIRANIISCVMAIAIVALFMI